jgi:hypothetical protein
MKEVKCKTCRCTDKHACKSGCYWINENICSACWLKNNKVNCECGNPEPNKDIFVGKFEGRYNLCKNCGGRVWH